MRATLGLTILAVSHIGVVSAQAGCNLKGAGEIDIESRDLRSPQVLSISISTVNNNQYNSLEVPIAIFGYTDSVNRFMLRDLNEKNKSDDYRSTVTSISRSLVEVIDPLYYPINFSVDFSKLSACPENISLIIKGYHNEAHFRRLSG